MSESSGLPRSLLGRTIADRYVPRAIVGRGGMGVVYAADDLRAPDSLVAFKALARQERDPARVLRFEREIEAMRRISHPAVVAIQDHGWLSHTEPWFVMELLDGTTLGERIQQGPMTARELAALLEPIGSALDALHAADMVHRDVKPGNILFEAGSSTRVKLGDFGLALVSDPGMPRLTDRRALLGTPAYVPPESLVQRWSGASDVYALGVLIFEALTGLLPFRGIAIDVLVAKRSGRAPSMADVSGRVFDPGLEELVAGALAREPGDRPVSSAALVRELARY